MLNFHHFSPAISACEQKSVCFDDGWLLFIVRNVLFSAHYNESNIAHINSLGSLISMHSTRGKKAKVETYTFLPHVHHSRKMIPSHICHFASEICSAPLCVGNFVLSVHVYCKPFMCLIKMNVFIYLLSTKTRGDQAWSCDV